MESISVTALVIGGGPAGLMAADELSAAGHRVMLAESKPSLARKFLMAGKSGLNLTKGEPFEKFLSAYGQAADWLDPMLQKFGPEQVQAWARSLGQGVFTGSSGRVFPNAMKASPLLRAWLRRLEAQGVEARTRWHWKGFDGEASLFETLDGNVAVKAQVTILALGGASWSRLGSDGHWTVPLSAVGVPLNPFKPANMGFSINWSTHMSKHFGEPVKPVRLIAADQEAHGEFVISAKGVEGSAVYAVSRHVREGAPLCADLLPDRSEAEIAARLAKPRGKRSLSNHLRREFGLAGVKAALLWEFAGAERDPMTLAAQIKRLPIRHAGPRPIDEAISVAGGVMRKAVDTGLMLKARPGVFCAGEMLDWEAPTGGYLLTACLATGRWAGRAAVIELGNKQ